MKLFQYTSQGNTELKNKHYNVILDFILSLCPRVAYNCLEEQLFITL